MSRYARYAQKVDDTQESIVAALRAAGWLVWIIGYPCDLLCYKAPAGFKTLEVKTATKSGKVPKRKDRAVQDEFCRQTLTPKVTSPEQALAALGLFPGVNIDTVHR